jgi:hypothetical protein
MRVEETTVEYPLSTGRGLCLYSTAIPPTLADGQLWLHGTTHQGVLTRCLSIPTVAEPLARTERDHSTEDVSPGRSVLVQNPTRKPRKVPGGELSLSSELERLSLHRLILTAEAKSGNKQHNWWQLLPVHDCRGLLATNSEQPAYL